MADARSHFIETDQSMKRAAHELYLIGLVRAVDGERGRTIRECAADLVRHLETALEHARHYRTALGPEPDEGEPA